MILLIDHYDSFVYNIARYISELGYEQQVLRYDCVSIQLITELNPSHIILSPGPCSPDQAKNSLIIVKHFAPSIPLLGICLGHQIIGQAFGAKIIHAKQPKHGKSSSINHSQQGLFANLSNPLSVGRYHSLIISQENFPNNLWIVARSEEDEIMAIQHHQYPIFGVQFHPESALTQQGHHLLNNFLIMSYLSSRPPQAHYCPGKK